MMMLLGQTNALWHYAAGRYPGKVGVLLGPSHYSKTLIRPWIPYALDNDAFIHRRDWSFEAWAGMIRKVRTRPIPPIWALIPDVVGDPAATRRNWDRYKGEAEGLTRAYAVQPGATPRDVPKDADVVFVGGGTSWRFRTAADWARHFPRVHVGAVNNIGLVWALDDLGIESVDGTGWFRDPSRADKLPALQDWIEGRRPDLGDVLALSASV